MRLGAFSYWECPVLMVMRVPEEFECPAECPNRKPTDTQRGKVGAYVFSGVLTLFLVFQCWSYERRDRQVPATIFLPVLLLIGVGLGVQVDPATVGSIIKK